MSGFSGPINTLPVGATPLGTDLVPTWQGSGASPPYTRQVSLTQMFTALGTVAGPGSAVSDNLAAFSGTTGKVIEDSGIPLAHVVQGPATSGSGNLPKFSGTSGNALVDSGISLSAIIPQIASIAALRAATTTTEPNSVVYVIGYRTGADGGEGTFWYNSGDTTSADNGGTIIVDASGRRWYRERSSLPLMLAWFGGTVGTANCAPALSAALAALPSPGGEIHISAGSRAIGSNVAFTYPAGPFSLTLSGEGADNTVLVWAANGGVTLNASDFKHTFHIKDLTIRGGVAPAGTGLTLNQSQPGGNFGQSDVVRVTFDGVTQSDSFNWAIQVFGWCNINYDTVCIYSNNAGGINLTGALATVFKYSILHNMDRCGFFGCATAVQYGSYAQGLTISQTNFVNGITGVLIPTGATGALSQLQLNSCEFTLTGVSVNIQAPIFEVQIYGCLIIVADNTNGIQITAAIGYSTFVGNVFVTNSLDVSTGGIVVAGAATDCMITGNTFQGLSTGISLGAATIEWNVQSNHYSNCTTNTVDSGTANTIGGGSP